MRTIQFQEKRALINYVRKDKITLKQETIKFKIFSKHFNFITWLNCLNMLLKILNNINIECIIRNGFK